jgi:hypothetical protein
MVPPISEFEGLKELLARKGFDEAAIDKFIGELIRACPWFLQPPDEYDPEPETKYGQLEAFFSKHGLSVHDLFEPEVDEREWDRVFEGVSEILQSFGATNDLEKPDFWIVEDFYGTSEILVDVVNQEALNDSLRKALRQLLKKMAPTYSIILRKTEAGGRRYAADEEVITA